MTESNSVHTVAMTAIEELIAIEACEIEKLKIEKDEDASRPIGTTYIAEDAMLFDKWHHEVSDFYYVN